MDISLSIAGHLTPYDYEAKTVGTSVVAGLTATKLEPTGSAALRDLGKCRLARIFVEGASVRFRDDGGDPSGTAGNLLNSGDYFYIGNLQQMKNLKVIRKSDASADATFYITYFR